MRQSVDSNRKMLLLDDANNKFFNQFVGTNNNERIIDKGNEIIKVYSNMLDFTKMEIAKKFTEDECNIIVKAVEGNFYSCDVSAVYYLTDLIKKYSFFKNDDFEDSQINNVSVKIKSLTEFQAYTLLFSCFQYLKTDRNDLYKYFLFERA